MAETSPTLVDDHTVSMKSGLKDRNNEARARSAAAGYKHKSQLSPA